MKDVEMSQSATPATRNEAMLRWKAPKVLVQNLPGHDHSDLARTLVDGCERLRMVGATSGEHSSTPRPPE